MVDEDYEYVNIDFENVEKAVCEIRGVTPEIARQMTPHETGYSLTFTKTMHMRQLRRLILVGLMQVLYFFANQAFEQTNIQPVLAHSESKEMVDRNKQDQIEVILGMLDHGMAILRDDKKVNTSEPVFGEIHSATHIPGGLGVDYVYRSVGMVMIKTTDIEDGCQAHIHEEDAFVCGNLVSGYWHGDDYFHNPGACRTDYIDGVGRISGD